MTMRMGRIAASQATLNEAIEAYFNRGE
jgi:hypothetical protein